MKQVQSIFLLLFFILYSVKSQTLSISEINTAGNQVKTNNYSLSYSIGGLATSTFKASGYLSQGFQQPYNLYISEPEYAQSDNSLKAKVFPNPATDYVYLSLISDKDAELCFLRVFDESGKEIELSTGTFEFSINQNIRVDLSSLRNGTYIIEVITIREKRKLVQFKVLKI